MTKFKNLGFGWICVACDAPESALETERSRLMSEGESESKSPRFSNSALARWADAERTLLECPQCGARERIDR